MADAAGAARYWFRWGSLGGLCRVCGQLVRILFRLPRPLADQPLALEDFLAADVMVGALCA